MTYKEAVNQATAAFTHISDSPALDARILLCHACKIEQTTVLAHPEQILSKQEITLFNKLLEQRSAGEPIAYITGEQEFWSLSFLVNEHVLIPRPETEMLVENALKLISNIKTPRILDLGTGSGVIAICIAKECKKCEVYASDISLDSLEIAKQNATKHKVDITFIHSDWLANINEKCFDLIACNPPYVGSNDPNLSHYVQKYEPSIAVCSKENGLHDMDKVIKQSISFLNTHGQLVVEHGYEQKTAVQKLFSSTWIQTSTNKKDMSRQNRVTYGCFE